MFIEILVLALGLVLVIKGADWLVDGASSLAKRFRVSDLAIGLTIVAFGTSAPELVVNVIASVEDHQEIVFGNIIGSNIFNLFAILGIAGLLSPLVVQSSTVWKEIPISFLAIIALFVLGNDFFSSGTPILSRIDGFILLVLFALFIYYVYKQLKRDPVSETTSSPGYSTLKIWSLITIGLVGLVIGGKLVVTNAIAIASALGMSEKVIGLTIVAAGTSLPELATSVVAALKKKNDIAVGNIIGSNIFNLFYILSVSAIIRPLAYDPISNTDLYILAAGTIFLFMAMFTGRKGKLDRWEASVLLLAYLGYTYYLINLEI